jgi:cytochrome c peroxidase
VIAKILIATCLLLQSLILKADLSQEQILQKAIEIYEIEPCSSPNKTVLSELGRQLFESKELSGDYDIGCSDCHLDDKGLTDGLPLAVGAGGHGVGEKRLLSDGAIVARNALTFFGRGREEFTAFFWDGKVDTDGQTIFSPFGDEISEKFNSALAVASVLPITERDELLGDINSISQNDLIHAAEDYLYQDRYEALSEALAARAAKSDLLSEIKLTLEIEDNRELELADLGNAIAEFITSEFSCTDSKWEKYLSGDKTALSNAAKKGGVLFFGKARCAGCHAPPLFSDFKYHSLGLPQGEIGPHSRNRDIGRAAVSNLGDDLFKFRTAPLISVGATSPYGHNGAFSTLGSIITFHINPITYYADNPVQKYSKSYFEAGKLLAARSNRLKYLEINSEEELNSIIEFLESL